MTDAPQGVVAMLGRIDGEHDGCVVVEVFLRQTPVGELRMPLGIWDQLRTDAEKQASSAWLSVVARETWNEARR